MALLPGFPGASRARSGGSSKDSIRLQVFLARCGLGSRRACETFIRHGRVTVNGAPVTQLGTKVSLGDSVTLDGRAVVPSNKKIYIAVHKPREYLCANSDPRAQAPGERACSLPPSADAFSTWGGWTSCPRGSSSTRMTASSPSSYPTRGRGSRRNTSWKPGGPSTKSSSASTPRASASVTSCTGARAYVLRGPHSALITLTEGKNRELRNVFTSRNIRLKRVHRLRVGPITLKGIPTGHFRRLTEREIRWFFDHGNSD